jgi:hypothetical protein
MNFTMHFSGYAETTTVSSVAGSKRSMLGPTGNQSKARRQTLASTLNTIGTDDGSDKDCRPDAARREAGRRRAVHFGVDLAKHRSVAAYREASATTPRESQETL